LLLILTLQAQATLTPSDAAQGFALCMKDLHATQTELKDLQTLDSTRSEYTKMLKSQRDDAFQRLEKSGPILPWYVWVVLGGAGATIAIRGLK
jgi:hypothetical protein